MAVDVGAGVHAQPAEFAPLTDFFAPRAIAVIGASQDPEKIGGRPLRYLNGSGYAGAVHGVNPKYDEVMGRPCWPNAAAIPDPVDVALIGLPAQHVPGAIDDCAAAGIRFAIVFSSGFAETGPEGRRRQEDLVSRAAAGGVRVLGPNTLGAASSSNGMMASFATLFDRHPKLLPGRVGFISQSGALGVFIYALAQDQGLGFSRFVSIGNEADVDVADFLAYLAEDDETVAVGGYLESIKDGGRFLAAAERVAAAGKPMSFLKVGRSEAGRRAAESHTGSLAGTDAIYDAALRQAGIVRAESPQGLVDFLDYHGRGATAPQPGGVGVLTISGGAGVWTADRLADFGVDLAELSPETTAKLADVLPAFASPQNPVDATGQILNQPELFAACLDALLDDRGVTTLVVLLGLQERNGTDLAAQIVEAGRRRPDVRIAVAWLAGPDAAYDLLRGEGISVFSDLARCVEAVAGSMTAARFGAARTARDVVAPAPLAEAPVAALGSAPTEHGSKALLRELGVPVPRGMLCADRDEAVQAAQWLAGPVVLKGQVRGLAHKTEHRLVRLGVEGDEAVAAAFDEIGASMAAAADAARVEGVLVEEMAAPGVEVIVGCVDDAAFGPTVMFGLGGVLVEVVEDVAFRVAPVDRDEALAMIDETRGVRILDGFRGGAVYDKAALADVIAAVSQLASTHRATIAEIEINPLRVLPEGQGVVALDALVVTHAGDEGEH